MSSAQTDVAHATDRNQRAGSSVVQVALNRLSSKSYRFRSCVSCEYDNGVLTVNGRLPSFYLKQMVQSLLRDMEGVERVDNRIVVVHPSGAGSHTGRDVAD